MTDAKILIVEDEPIPANDIRVKLEKMGYTVVDTVSFGREAVEKAEGVDIVLMDIRLRGKMDGTDAAKEIKDRFDIPVVFLTALSDDRTLGNALKADPSGYLGKPFRESDLRTTIEVSLHKHEIEKKLRVEREKYRSLFKNLNEGMVLHEICYDKDGRPVDYIIKDANPRFEELTGISRKDAVGKKATKVYGTEKAPYLEKYSKLAETRGRLVFETYYEQMDKYFHISTFSTTKGKFVTLFSDITERKLAERNLRNHLMRYDLHEGFIYLAEESRPRISLEAFKDLLNVGYPGLVFSTLRLRVLKKYVEHEFDYYWLTKKDTRYSLPPEPEAIKLAVERMTRPSAVLFHRLDYVITESGINETVSLLSSLRETAQFRDHIVILPLDPGILDSVDFRRLKQETEPIRPKGCVALSESLLELLRLVYDQNLVAVKPDHKFIREELNISKPTLRNRIDRLLRKGYVKERPKGRTKVLEITDKGRRIFHR